MERTRIVHYTTSRKPVILSPSSPTPRRLPSSASMSSIVSALDDQAPLASVESEFPSTPRRSSKSSDKNGVRSSSTGRLLDDSKLDNSVYTALRCQDYPTSSQKEIDNTDKKERRRSDLIPPLNGTSSNAVMDDAMRRHSMGTWSRSRRKPQQEASNTTGTPRESATLPRHNADSTSPGTLVKSRRRYTWLSSKQTVPQSPKVATPHRQRNGATSVQSLTHDTSGDVSPVATSCPTIKRPLTKQDIPFPMDSVSLKDMSAIHRTDSITKRPLTTNEASKDKLDPNFPCGVSTIPRTDPIIKRPLTTHAINDTLTGTSTIPRTHPAIKQPFDSHGTINNNPPEESDSLNDISTIPRVEPIILSPHRKPSQNSNDLNNTTSSNGTPSSPITDLKLESPGLYNWRRDPRRRPCNFDHTFDLSPPEPVPGTRDPPSTEYNANNCDDAGVDYLFSATNTIRNNGLLPPDTKTSPDSSFTCNMSSNFDSETPNTVHHPSPTTTNSYNDLPNPGVSFLRENKIPLNEPEALPHSQCLSNNNIHNQNGAFSRYGDRKAENKDPQLEFQTSPKKTIQLPSNPSTQGYRDCLVRHSLQVTSRGGDGQNQSLEFNKHKANTFLNSQYKSNLTKKSKSVSVFSGVERNNSPEHILKSPRTRNSFKLAVGSNWDDVFPSMEKLPKVSQLSDILESNASPTKENKYSRNPSFGDNDVFVSCNDLVSPNTNKSNEILSERATRESTYFKSVVIPSPVNSTLDGEEARQSEDYDSLTRRIKRNSLRLATASLSDLTCALDDIDINIENVDGESTALDSMPGSGGDIKQCNPSPVHSALNLSRTGSLLSSKHSSSHGSYYSCRSVDTNSCRNSPNPSLRKELQARLDSPISHQLTNYQDRLNVNSSRTSSPVSMTSSGRSSHRQRPAYYWTRQTPYPRLLYARSSSVASSRCSGDYRTSSPQPSITSSIPCRNPNARNNDVNTKIAQPVDNAHSSRESPAIFNNGSRESRTIDHADKQNNDTQRQNSSTRAIDRRSMTLPISNSCYSPDYFYQPPYSTDLSPSSVIESPNAVLSPPSLGRPRRKQYAGFDSQPLPMDSFMSDSSSVYTGVSCSSRATDMTGNQDNGQFDESFISDDIRSCFEEDSRGDISFDMSETMQPSSLVSDISKETVGSESKHGSVHSTSTTKQENEDSTVEEKGRDDSSQHNTSDDFIENSSYNSSIKLGKQFGSEYDALFRLYKSDDLFTTPSCPIYSPDGKAFSSSCLLRSQLYSKRKFLSSRDIFGLIQNSDKNRPDGTVSLTSLEHHAHKVCEAILYCNEMDQGYINKDTHSLV